MSAQRPSFASLRKLVRSQKVILMLGAGGVGKTTSSIAMAILAASEGRRVALLSIDPAKRLAAALGIPLGGQLVRLEWPSDISLPGSIDAAMLDQKAVFDAMVRRHGKSASVVDKILEHPLYIAASTDLSGPLEYMALAKLHDLAKDPQYDLVVIDTPPDTHALDFLARPNVLSGFMESQVMTWLIKPFLAVGRFGLGRLLSASERLMGGIAKVTGFSALRSFAEFLLLMQDVLAGFQKTGETITQLLRDMRTSFVIVTVPTAAAVRSARHLAKEVSDLGYGIDLLLFNRALPAEVAASIEGVTQPWPQGYLKARQESETARMTDLTQTIGPMLKVVLPDQSGDQCDARAIFRLADRLGQS